MASRHKHTLDLISEKYGIKKSILTKRVFKLKIKGKVLGKDASKYYTRVQVEKIIMNIPRNYRTSSRNINIIEIYKKGFAKKDIAKLLSMSERIVYEVTKEFDNFQTVTVESKINAILID